MSDANPFLVKLDAPFEVNMDDLKMKLFRLGWRVWRVECDLDFYDNVPEVYNWELITTFDTKLHNKSEQEFMQWIYDQNIL